MGVGAVCLALGCEGESAKTEVTAVKAAALTSLPVKAQKPAPKPEDKGPLRDDEVIMSKASKMPPTPAVRLSQAEADALFAAVRAHAQAVSP